MIVSKLLLNQQVESKMLIFKGKFLQNFAPSGQTFLFFSGFSRIPPGQQKSLWTQGQEVAGFVGIAEFRNCQIYQFIIVSTNHVMTLRYKRFHHIVANFIKCIRNLEFFNFHQHHYLRFTRHSKITSYQHHGTEISED